MKAIAIADPFNYAVHGFKKLTSKKPPACSPSPPDLAFLLIFTVLA